jgi:hypothetical protein
MGPLRWAAVAVTSIACGGPTGPTVASVAGTYNAVEFTITGFTGEAVDYLALGGSVVLTLDGDGASDGTFAMPGGTHSVPLSGTWTLTDSVVAVHIDSKEYPGDMTVRVRGQQLAGGGGWPDADLRLRLVKGTATYRENAYE